MRRTGKQGTCIGNKTLNKSLRQRMGDTAKESVSSGIGADKGSAVSMKFRESENHCTFLGSNPISLRKCLSLGLLVSDASTMILVTSQLGSSFMGSVAFFISSKKNISLT